MSCFVKEWASEGEWKPCHKYKQPRSGLATRCLCSQFAELFAGLVAKSCGCTEGQGEGKWSPRLADAQLLWAPLAAPVAELNSAGITLQGNGLLKFFLASQLSVMGPLWAKGAWVQRAHSGQKVKCCEPHFLFHSIILCFPVPFFCPACWVTTVWVSGVCEPSAAECGRAHIAAQAAEGELLRNGFADAPFDLCLLFCLSYCCQVNPVLPWSPGSPKQKERTSLHHPHPRPLWMSPPASTLRSTTPSIWV